MYQYCQSFPYRLLVYREHVYGLSTVFASGRPHRSHIELPFYSKFLLIASYFASYNPAKTDKRFFSKVVTVASNTSGVKTRTRLVFYALSELFWWLLRVCCVFAALD